MDSTQFTWYPLEKYSKELSELKDQGILFGTRADNIECKKLVPFNWELAIRFQETPYHPLQLIEMGSAITNGPTMKQNTGSMMFSHSLMCTNPHKAYGTDLDTGNCINCENKVTKLCHRDAAPENLGGLFCPQCRDEMMTGNKLPYHTLCLYCGGVRQVLSQHSGKQVNDISEFQFKLGPCERIFSCALPTTTTTASSPQWEAEPIAMDNNCNVKYTLEDEGEEQESRECEQMDTSPMSPETIDPDNNPDTNPYYPIKVKSQPKPHGVLTFLKRINDYVYNRSHISHPLVQSTALAMPPPTHPVTPKAQSPSDNSKKRKRASDKETESGSKRHKKSDTNSKGAKKANGGPSPTKSSLISKSTHTKSTTLTETTRVFYRLIDNDTGEEIGENVKPSTKKAASNKKKTTTGQQQKTTSSSSSTKKKTTTVHRKRQSLGEVHALQLPQQPLASPHVTPCDYGKPSRSELIRIDLDSCLMPLEPLASMDTNSSMFHKFIDADNAPYSNQPSSPPIESDFNVEEYLYGSEMPAFGES